MGRVKKHVQQMGGESYQLEYDYNLLGNLTSEKYPSGRIVNLTVDAIGRVSTVADSNRTYLAAVTFNDRAMLARMDLGNGLAETFEYSDRGQQTGQAVLKGTSVLQKYEYTFGSVNLATGDVDGQRNNGQLGKIESWIGSNKQRSERFGYDELGRLNETREYRQGDNAQLTYKQKLDFDRFANLYRKAANNPSSGQASPQAAVWIEDAHIDKVTNRFAPGNGITYDPAGNVISDTKFGALTYAYS